MSKGRWILTDFQAVAPSRDVSKFDYLDDVRFHQATAMDDTGDRKRKPHTLEIVEPSIASRATVWCVCVWLMAFVSYWTQMVLIWEDSGRPWHIGRSAEIRHTYVYKIIWIYSCLRVSSTCLAWNPLRCMSLCPPCDIFAYSISNASYIRYSL